jgi:hypothetical protein
VESSGGGCFLLFVANNSVMSTEQERQTSENKTPSNRKLSNSKQHAWRQGTPKEAHAQNQTQNEHHAPKAQTYEPNSFSAKV